MSSIIGKILGVLCSIDQMNEEATCCPTETQYGKLKPSKGQIGKTLSKSQGDLPTVPTPRTAYQGSQIK